MSGVRADFSKAASILLENWWATTRISELPEDCRPTSRAEGYAAAAAVAGASGSRIAGWKIAATSEAGRSTSMSTGRSSAASSSGGC